MTAETYHNGNSWVLSLLNSGNVVDIPITDSQKEELDLAGIKSDS